MRRTNISWGLFLVLIGTLFLLGNLGIIRFNFWQLLWPLFFIWIGVNLLMGSRRGAATVEHLTLPIKGIEAADIQIDYGAGELYVHGRTAPDELLDGEFAAGIDYDIRERGERTRVRLRSPIGKYGGWHWFGPNLRRDWTVGLNNAIPLTLEVNSGASKTVLNLTDLQLTSLRLKTGASETTVKLPAQAGHTRVRGETGLAEVRFDVPESVAARIRTSGGLSDIQVDEARFPRAGSSYQSADYETAENKVEIDLSVGLGSAKIR